MSANKEKIVNDLGIKIFHDLHKMLEKVDILSINVPLTDQTRNLIGSEELMIMN